MRTNNNHRLKVARLTGGDIDARTLPSKLDLLALGSLLALLIIGRGAGTG